MISSLAPAHTWIHPEGRGWNETKWRHVMLCYMSARVAYGLATWPCPKLESRRYVYSSHHWPLRWPSTNDERDGPLLIPFDSGLSTLTKPLGHDFANQKNCPQCSVLLPMVLCCDMEHGAQMSVTLCCLLQHKTYREVSRRSVQVPRKRPITHTHTWCYFMISSVPVRWRTATNSEW